jgi:hypothetical protein
MWLLGALTVLAIAALAAALTLGAVRRAVARDERRLPPLPPCPPEPEPEAATESGATAGLNGDQAKGAFQPGATPGGAAALTARRARYLGTTWAPSPVRRVAGHGLLGRGTVDLALDHHGLRIHPGGRGRDWCIPAEALRGAELTTHHAGKEVYAPRVVVVDWLLGDTRLRSGFELEAPAARAWTAALRQRIGAVS